MRCIVLRRISLLTLPTTTSTVTTCHKTRMTTTRMTTPPYYHSSAMSLELMTWECRMETGVTVTTPQSVLSSRLNLRLQLPMIMQLLISQRKCLAAFRNVSGSVGTREVFYYVWYLLNSHLAVYCIMFSLIIHLRSGFWYHSTVHFLE